MSTHEWLAAQRHHSLDNYHCSFLLDEIFAFGPSFSLCPLDVLHN